MLYIPAVPAPTAGIPHRLITAPQEIALAHALAALLQAQRLDLIYQRLDNTHMIARGLKALVEHAEAIRRK